MVAEDERMAATVARTITHWLFMGLKEGRYTDSPMTMGGQWEALRIYSLAFHDYSPLSTGVWVPGWSCTERWPYCIQRNATTHASQTTG